MLVWTTDSNIIIITITITTGHTTLRYSTPVNHTHNNTFTHTTHIVQWIFYLLSFVIILFKIEIMRKNIFSYFSFHDWKIVHVTQYLVWNEVQKKK